MHDEGRATLLWHPHQKLWNKTLVGRVRRWPGGRALVLVLRTVDSLLLAGRVLARRRRRLGLAALVRLPRLPRRAVYVDCGLHKTAAQARLVGTWYHGRLDLDIVAIEASPNHADDASAALASVPRARVHRVALVGPGHAGDTVRLYQDGGSGLGDSLFAARGHDYHDVPAVRLSKLLLDLGIHPASVPVVVRMNIEGAESFVVEDLVEAGLDGEIAGYYGMWDDLSKIDPARDAEFRELLRRRSIEPVTFNDRDLKSRLRLWAIRYDLDTSLAAAARASGQAPA